VVSASSGSASKSHAPLPSHMLLALGVEGELALKAIRSCPVHPLVMDEENSTAANDIVQAASTAPS
jgi:cysteine sulfinate desulfinase/cysteine desulfurase-like protein